MQGNFCHKGICFVSLLGLVITATYSQKTIGYSTFWSGNADSIPYSCLTHINYAFALPNADGHLRPLENTAKLQELISLSHNAGVKVLISIGGWSDENGPLDPVFETIGANPSYRNNLINDIVSLVDSFYLDGADVDWEYPDAGNSAANFDSLMTRLYQLLHPEGKLVTAAVAGNSWGGGGIHAYLKNFVDWVNIMCYDFNEYNHSTFDESIAGVQYYKSKGFPDSLLALGVPFYGRNTWESYADLVKRGANPYQDAFDGVGYNGLVTMQKKADYVKTNELAGIMIWELSQDLSGEYSLLSCICNTFSGISAVDGYPVEDVLIYPNPSHGFISVDSKETISEYYLYDAHGRMANTNVANSSKLLLDLSSFPAGIYFLNLKFKNSVLNVKIIKTNDL